jgi:hypothetical protein
MRPAQAGVASATTSRQVGIALGVAVFGAIASDDSVPASVMGLRTPPGLPGGPSPSVS